jgi:translation initiation factor IF-2
MRGVCANSPRPELCLRRVAHERRGEYGGWRGGDGSGRGDGMGWRRRGGGWGDGMGWRRGGGGGGGGWGY